MKKITVFTPTYNRAHLLPRLYKSLCRQTSKDFLWLVIDDGSSDGTEQLIQKWQAENRIEIQYHYKENGGMHTGHNAAYKIIVTELNLCIDSDDYMPENGIAVILEAWDKVENKDDVSGIVGLDATANGVVIGSRMPQNVGEGSYHDLYTRYKAMGDKKFVLKTKELKKYPLYPEYENEKLVPLGILYIMMGDEKPFFFLDDVICIVEYQEGGSSNTILKQYFQSPKGFAYARKIRLKHTSSAKDILKNCLHLSSLFFITHDFKILHENNKFKFLTILLLPVGFVFYKYLQLKK
ncbi:glycosyltransferase family 2 protein [Kaistella daneshvariae]|uniref:Glycosyltransferase family 2 protein n=1 Tax=Kaistella daneshvariae TaxID=2487074 RepID=A0ABM7C6N3_9FLAO|nr:glycosyltransferase family 2 protein [Kaistella daneshvariae]AZI66623.1 glycosyltransferase family 2 protein [Kaistella daneshvariae]